MKSGTEKNPNPCEAPLGRYLGVIARSLSQKSADAYTLARDGSLRRKFKPARRKKDRRKLRHGDPRKEGK